MKRRILITGGAGFIGSLLTTKLLERGDEVIVLDSLYFKQSSLVHCSAFPNFKFIHGDARDIKLVESLIGDVDIIIPLACLVGAPLCSKFPDEATSVNLEAIKMIESLRDDKQKIIYPTTNSGYGTKSGDTYCDENTPLDPISHYGKTKVDAEAYLLRKKNVVTLRLATIFGTSYRTRTDLLVNDFVCQAIEKGELVLFEKHFLRNFIHIRDVVDCFLYVMDNFREMSGECYNLGLDEANISKEQLAYKIKEHIPSLVISESKDGKDPDKRNYIVSNQKLRDAGFEAKRSLDEGIAELIKVYPMICNTRTSNV